jgi:hypothetical protein
MRRTPRKFFRSWIAAVRARLTIRYVIPNLLLGAIVATASTSISSTQSSGETHRDQVQASEINLRMRDLPTSIVWTSSPGGIATNMTAAATAAHRRALACGQRALGSRARLSRDPFDFGGQASGDVTADVVSPLFSAKGASGLALVSDVVVVSSAEQANTDLRAFSAAAILSCVATFYKLLADDEPSLKGVAVTVTATHQPAQRLGTGDGGTAIMVEVTLSVAHSVPLARHIELFLYVEQRAEVGIIYSYDSAIPAGLTSSVNAKVMARAEELADS